MNEGMTKEEAIEYFKSYRKIVCEDHLKICPKDSIAYQATLKEKEFYDMAIKALEQEPSEDCVSRQAVLEVLKNNRYRFNISQEGYCEGKVLWSENLIKDDACKGIEQLLPVTPTRKKGKWIEEPNCWLRCSCCNSHHPHTSIYAIRGSNYCPECGAEMESEE